MGSAARSCCAIDDEDGLHKHPYFVNDAREMSIGCDKQGNLGALVLGRTSGQFRCPPELFRQVFSTHKVLNCA